MNAKEFLRFASLGALVLASSCAAPVNDVYGLRQDASANHPILVDPDYKTVRLPFSVSEAGLLPDDNARFLEFVNGYLSNGSGSIAIAVAPNPNGDAAIRYFGERVAELGVPRDRIMISRRQDLGDNRVELNYVGYRARVANCNGDWPTDAAITASNLVMPQFGCANQKNIAAMVADPRDIISPRDMTDRDNPRRADVFEKFGNGEPTATTKTEEQSGTIANVNN